MFGYGDKVSLVGINIINKNRKNVGYSLSFPIVSDNLCISDDVIMMDIFEYHEGHQQYGYTAFKIYVGETTSIREICENKDKVAIFDENAFREIKSVDDRMCYYDDLKGNHMVFAKVNKEDVVVGNVEELKDVLLGISDNFKNIKDSTMKIKKHVKN